MKNKFMDSVLGKWIKRIVIIVIVMGLVAFGVIKLVQNKTSNVEKSALETLESLESYYMEATMDFYKGEDSRSYVVKVSYKDTENEDLFKVSMFDKASNQEQIIIKNNEGVYVLTPALNQAYKFNGSWPLNGHKPYLYHSMVETMQKDCDISKLDDGYLVTSVPEFKNMPSWARQEMKLSKEYKPLWVHIYDNNNDVAVKIGFSKVEFNPTFSENYFNVEDNVKESRENFSTTTSFVPENLPLYPTNADVEASLKEVSNITVNGASQVMLTYSGKDSFTIIESKATSNETYTEMPVNGEIVDIFGVFGYVVTNSNINKLYFTYNGVSYQLYSNTVDVATLIEIASGMEYVTDLK